MDAQVDTNKKTVLIVEDDLFLQGILAMKLEKAGFVVERALDGKEAFSILEKNRADLILLDLLLPGMEGYEVLQHIKETSQWASIPVIIASNLDDKMERKRVEELGAVDYLVKAEHTPDEIVRRVSEQLRG